MRGARELGLAAAIVVLVSHAGAPTAALAVLNYDFSLGARGMQTDNLYLDPEPQVEGQRAPVEETVVAAIPALHLDWREGQDSLLLDFRSEYWAFSGDEELDAMWIPNASAELGWRRWKPFFLEANALRDRVPYSQDREGEALVEQPDRTSARVRTGLSWDRGANRTVELAYRGEIEDFSGGGEERDDRVTRHYGEGLVRHRWSPRLGGEASARYGMVEQELAEDYRELSVGAGADYRLSERLTVRGRVEWRHEDRDVPVSEDGGGDGTDGTLSNLLGNLQLRGELDRGGFWSLRYDERLEAQPDGDTLQIGRAAADGLVRARLGSEVRAGIWHEDREYRVSGRDETDWGPTLLARWMIAPWVALDLGGSWTDATIREPEEDEIEDRTARAGAALVVLVGRHFLAEAGYVYRENDSTDDGRDYTSNVFSAGLTYYFKIIPPGRLPASAVVNLAFSDDLFPDWGH